MKRQISTGLRFLAVMTILTGAVYPGIITVTASLFFPREAYGSLIESHGKIIGSELIGQNFDSLIYFSSRPSFNNYDPLPSGASNLGPLNPLLIKLVKKREKFFIQQNNLKDHSGIPPEMVTASASGLDPHISPSAALIQVHRIALARGMDRRMQDHLVGLINDLTEKPQFSLLGEPRINVFLLNLKTDSLK